MKKTNRIIVFLIVLTMISGIVPISIPVSADTAVTVFYTLSHDGIFKTGNDTNNTVMAMVPMEIEYFDLSEYGLSDFTYLPGQPTLLHLYIRIIEQFYHADGSKLTVGGTDFAVSGSSGGMLLNHFWDHDMNLMYFINHAYPAVDGMGSTADQILLEDGMEIDHALFTDWSFYTTGGFLSFDKTNESVYTGDTLEFQTFKTNSFPDWETGISIPVPFSDAAIKIYDENWVEKAVLTTDAQQNGGAFSYTFDQEGTYYVTAFEPKAATSIADTAPGVATVKVEAASLWGGTGTEQDPYTIENAAGLMLLASTVNAAGNIQTLTDTYFKLTNDIQLDADWPAIGLPFVATAWVNPNGHQGPSFDGVFDGDGHTISFAYGSLPLFGAIWKSAVIRNLNIYSPYIAGNGLIAGVTAQYASGDPNFNLIENVTIKSGTKIRGSGFAETDGFRPNHLDIRNCTIEQDVWIGWDDEAGQPYDHNLTYFANTAGTGPGVGSFVGGLAGFISDSVSYATVFGHANVLNVGGLVGYKQQSMREFLIERSEFHGTIIAPESKFVGGILGAGYDSPNPRNATATGQLSGFYAAPNTPGSNIIDCTVTATITGYDYVGGIVGGEFANQTWGTGNGPNATNHNLVNNHFDGTLVATAPDAEYVGGIIGYVRSLNRHNNIIGNTFTESSGAEKGIGYAAIIDTNNSKFAVPGGSFKEIDGVYYINTAGSAVTLGVSGFGGIVNSDHFRTDDPMGQDANVLAAQVEQVEQEQVGPVIANPSGGTVVKGKTVILSTSTSDALIYYTTDGSEPTESSLLYSHPIVIEDDMTITAKAIKPSMLDSVVSVFTYTVIEAPVGSAILSVEKVTGAPGDEVSVDVSIERNPGIAAFTIELNFDNTYVYPILISNDAILSGGTFTSNVQQPDAVLEQLSLVTANWSNENNISCNGVLFTIKFKIKDDAPEGEIPLTITIDDQGNLINESQESVTHTLVPGTINVSQRIMGDIFADGVINAKDALKLTQYLAGWDISMTENELKAADVYADGKVDVKDALKLGQYLAKWTDVVLGE